MCIDAGTFVDDPILARLASQTLVQEELLEEFGLQNSRQTDLELDSREVTAPYDLEPEAPRALSLAKLLALSRIATPPEIAAASGENEALVILHGLTPFHRQGQRPKEIWGMGYTAVPRDAEAARTVCVEPATRLVKAIEIEQALSIDLDARGQMTASTSSGPSMPVAAGLSAGASTRQGFALSLRLEWSVVEVQAGPVGSGGARWNLYRQGSRIDRHHRLLQTMLVPRGTRTLTFDVDTWVRRHGLFGGLLGSRHWASPRRTFTVEVET